MGLGFMLHWRGTQPTLAVGESVQHADEVQVIQRGVEQFDALDTLEVNTREFWNVMGAVCEVAAQRRARLWLIIGALVMASARHPSGGGVLLWRERVANERECVSVESRCVDVTSASTSSGVGVDVERRRCALCDSSIMGGVTRVPSHLSSAQSGSPNPPKSIRVLIGEVSFPGRGEQPSRWRHGRAGRALVLVLAPIRFDVGVCKRQDQMRRITEVALDAPRALLVEVYGVEALVRAHREAKDFVAELGQEDITVVRLGFDETPQWPRQPRGAGGLASVRAPR